MTAASWYYISDRRERLRFTEAEVSDMVQARLLRAETMVWSNGMEGWVSVSEVHPEWIGHPAARGSGSGEVAQDGAAASKAVRSLGGALAASRGWLVFLAAVIGLTGLVIVGWLGFSVLTNDSPGVIWGLALLPAAVFGGIAATELARCSGGFPRAAELGQLSHLEAEIERMGRAWRLLGTGAAVSMVLVLVAALLVFFLYPAAGGSSGL